MSPTDQPVTLVFKHHAAVPFIEYDIFFMEGGVSVMMMTNLVKWKAIHFISKRESSEPANVPTHEFQLFIFPLVFLPE